MVGTNGMINSWQCLKSNGPFLLDVLWNVYTGPPPVVHGSWECMPSLRQPQTLQTCQIFGYESMHKFSFLLSDAWMWVSQDQTCCRHKRSLSRQMPIAGRVVTVGENIELRSSTARSPHPEKSFKLDIECLALSTALAAFTRASREFVGYGSLVPLTGR